MCDDCSAEGTGGVGGAVLSQRPQTGFTEDVVAGVTHVRAEVHIQAHRADVTFPVPGTDILLILAAAAAGWVPCRALGARPHNKRSNMRFLHQKLYFRPPLYAVFVLSYTALSVEVLSGGSLKYSSSLSLFILFDECKCL